MSLHTSKKETSSNIVALEEFLVKCKNRKAYSKSTIVISGDRNARIGSWTTHLDLDDGGAGDDEPITVQIIQVVSDTVTNIFGKIRRTYLRTTY